jgi:two-component system sensor histidine kinase AtoS
MPGGVVSPAKVVASAPLLEGWELVIAVDENRLAEPIAQLRKTLAWMLGATLIGILGVIGVFYRRSAARIRKLTEGAEAIAHGNLRWRLEDRGDDELSTLSRAFNRMAEQLQTLIDSAVQSERMASLGKLATTIAHEVRNPLASIKTGVQVVQENLRDDEQARILRNVIAEIDRLNRVASDLLGFARPLPTRAESAPVDELVERVRSLVERQAAKHNVRISAEIDPGLTIRVDPNQIQQVLMNLVLNSIHAMPHGGELRFRARMSDHRVVIDVSDTGVGMAPDTIERVMRPFVSSRPDGTGIGLSVSNQLVERNQGRMEIQSAPLQGTTVSLVFPAA